MFEILTFDHTAKFLTKLPTYAAAKGRTNGIIEISGILMGDILR